MFRSPVRFAATLASTFVVAASAWGQLPDPRLTVIYPPGGQRGTEVEVAIQGTDLDEATSLVFSHSGIVGRPKTEPPRAFETEPRTVPDRFVATIAADVPPGIYEARALGRFGLSTPRAFVVGTLPEAVETGNLQSLESAMPISLDSVVTGRTSGDGYDVYRFPVVAGTRVGIRADAARIDSKADVAMELLDATGGVIARGRDDRFADSAIDFVAATDGDLYVKVYDSTFRGGDAFLYRVTVTGGPALEGLFPPVAAPSATQAATWFGRRLPGGGPAASVASKDGLSAGVTVDSSPVERLDRELASPAQADPPDVTWTVGRRDPIDADFAGFETRLDAQGEPVLVGFATAPIVREVEPNDDPATAPLIETPCEIVGDFAHARDRDRFRLRAKQGERFAIEVVSQRLGLATDPEIVIERLGVDAEGKPTATEVVVQDDVDRAFRNPPFDKPQRDPALVFVADADGEYRVSVRDLAGESVDAAGEIDPRRVYALAVRPPAPDFRLLATAKNFAEPLATGETSSSTVLRQGGTAPVLVQIYRRDGFDGELTLSAVDLPSGVECPPVVVPAGRNSALLILSATADAPAVAAPLRLVGEATIDGRAVRRAAPGAIVVSEKNGTAENAVARMTPAPTFSVVAEPAPIAIEIAGERSLSAVRGTPLSIPVRVVRREGAKGAVSVAVEGLPKEIVATPLELAEGTNEGALELKVDAKAPLGLSPFVLTGKSQFAYRRNPEAVTAAETKLAALDATIAKLTAEAVDPGTLNAAAEERKVLEKRVADLKTAAEPKDVSVVAWSLPLSVNVAEAPAP